MKPTTRSFASLGILAMLLTFTAGCSSFHQQWKTALDTPVVTHELTGPWDGHWLSNVNGHNGRLRCVITKGVTNEYHARFYANYKKVLSFGYTVPLTVQMTNGAYRFSGEANLGWWAGGLYRYNGQATPTNFFATYDSKYDRGIFEMKRPK